MAATSQESAVTLLAGHSEVEDERESFALRLAAAERTNQELVERLGVYERERAEIKARLEGILARLGPAR
jgi:hypothetical protein